MVVHECLSNYFSAFYMSKILSKKKRKKNTSELGWELFIYHWKFFAPKSDTRHMTTMSHASSCASVHNYKTNTHAIDNRKHGWQKQITKTRSLFSWSSPRFRLGCSHMPLGTPYIPKELPLKNCSSIWLSLHSIVWGGLSHNPHQESYLKLKWTDACKVLINRHSTNIYWVDIISGVTD